MPSSPFSISLNQNKLSQTFTLTANGNATAWNSPSDQIIKDSYNNEVTFHFEKVSNTNTTQKYNVTVSGAVNNFNFPESKSVSVKFTANNATLNSSDSASKNVSFTFASDYCGSTPNVQINNVRVLKGYGNNNDWYPLDEVQVEVRVVNNGNWDVNNLELRWALYDKRNGRRIASGREDGSRLREGDEKTMLFNFTLDNNIDYLVNDGAVLYVRASGRINNFNGAYDRNNTCDSYKDNNVNIVANSDFVVVDNLKLNGLKASGLYNKTLSCGQDMTFAGNIWNIGHYDQNDLTLEFYNKDLGLLKDIPFNEIRAFDSQNFNYNFVIPKDAKEKLYYITLRVLDNNKNIYQSDDRNEVSEKVFSVNVDHCSITEPSITAVLASDAKSGEEMKINATITNLDSDNVTFNIGAQGYDSWAKLVS